MEVICIDGSFSAEQLDFWSKHGVSHPQQDSLYTIQEVRTHTTGDVGLILEEIQNPKVPIEHPVLGVVMMDVTFNINRFRTLSGETIKKEELDFEKHN